MNIKFDIFSYMSANKLLRIFIKTQPQKGRGLIKNIADHLDISSPQVSQFLSGIKIITVDQAYQIGRYFSWSELEMEYWLTLVEYERASHHEAKKYFHKKLEKIRLESLKVAKVVSLTTEISDEDKATFYSSWIYSALRLYCSIGQGKDIHELHQAFPEIEPAELNEILNFLIHCHLLKKEGLHFELGMQRTFVPKNSPFLKQHLCNWRIKAIERASFITDEEIMFSAPMSISEAGFKKVRRELQDWVKNISENLVSYGDAERVACLNLDLFKISHDRIKK